MQLMDRGKPVPDRVVIPVERITRAILLLRGQKAMLDEALAELYGVEVKVLNQAVKRNADRFPADFMLQLTAGETAVLRSQIVTLKTGSGRHRKYRPYAFTEQGVLEQVSRGLYRVAERAPDEMWRYARFARVSRVMQPYLEALL